jgi:N-acetylneuraminic acid mutarotase
MRPHLGKTSFALALLVAAVLDTAGPVLAQTWTAAPSTPVAVARGAGVWFPGNSRFYILGGRPTDLAGSDLLNPLEYDTASNTWATKASVFPTNEVNNMVGAVLTEGSTQYIFCVGGSAAGAVTATPTVRRYDPIADVITIVATDPWPTIPNTLPGGRAVLNNKLYVFGGFTIGVGMTNQIWSFDPAALPGTRWTLKTAILPVPVGYVPCAAIGSLIYIAGGATFNAGTGALADSAGSYVYDPAADMITPITPTPRATGETIAVNNNGQLWVCGGGRTAPNPSNQVDSYSPSSNTWSLAPSFVLARRNAAIDRDLAGNIYLAGGYAPATQTANFEIFRQGSNSFCAGDGSGTPCPCANSGAAGNGCANSGNASGGNLSSTGTASIASDTLSLVGTGMVTVSPCSYFQGTTQTSVAFGDGLRCASGALIRLGQKFNDAAGASSYPVGAELPIHIKGMVAAGNTRTYQTIYRDANPTFCIPFTFNTTNGLFVAWAP